MTYMGANPIQRKTFCRENRSDMGTAFVAYAAEYCDKGRLALGTLLASSSVQASNRETAADTSMRL